MTSKTARLALTFAMFVLVAVSVRLYQQRATLRRELADQKAAYASLKMQWQHDSIRRDSEIADLQARLIASKRGEAPLPLTQDEMMSCAVVDSTICVAAVLEAESSWVAGALYRAGIEYVTVSKHGVVGFRVFPADVSRATLALPLPIRDRVLISLIEPTQTTP